MNHTVGPFTSVLMSCSRFKCAKLVCVVMVMLLRPSHAGPTVGNEWNAETQRLAELPHPEACVPQTNTVLSESRHAPRQTPHGLHHHTVRNRTPSTLSSPEGATLSQHASSHSTHGSSNLSLLLSVNVTQKTDTFPTHVTHAGPFPVRR